VSSRRMRSRRTAGRGARRRGNWRRREHAERAAAAAVGHELRTIRTLSPPPSAPPGRRSPKLT
jgi:hypothetical protein